jgi:hypothetical protein
MQRPGKLTREQRMTPYERMLQEKRMQENQLTGPYQAPTGTAAINRAPVRIERRIPRPDPNNFPHLCSSEPLTAFRPEAVVYSRAISIN